MDASITLDIAALKEIAHYAHWIPANRGLTDKWMGEHYPDWHWNEFIPKMKMAGILVSHTDDPECVLLAQQIYIKKDVVAVTVNRRDGEISFTINKKTGDK
jgi:hypothetical protein